MTITFALCFDSELYAWNRFPNRIEWNASWAAAHPCAKKGGKRALRDDEEEEGKNE